MQVSRTTRKVGPGASQRPCASLRFDKRNRLGLGHRLAAVLAVRTGQCRGQLEPDHLAANDGRRKHAISVREGSHRDKRSDPGVPEHLRLIRTKRDGLTCRFSVSSCAASDDDRGDTLAGPSFTEPTASSPSQGVPECVGCINFYSPCASQVLGLPRPRIDARADVRDWFPALETEAGAARRAPGGVRAHPSGRVTSALDAYRAAPKPPAPRKV